LARRSHVLDFLAEVAAMDLRSAGPGRTDEPDGEPLVVGHRHESSLAIARQAFDANVLRVHGLVGLEIVEGPAGPPRPRAQRPPAVRLAGLALVAKADAAGRQTLVVAVFAEPPAGVRLDAGGGNDGESPAFFQHLLLPVRRALDARWSLWPLQGDAFAGPKNEPELHDDRHRA